MTYRTLSGRLVSKTTAQYRVKWDAKCLSKMQFAVKAFLRKYWEGDICYEEFPVFGTKMRFDLLNATKKIAVETHGDQHRQFSPFFHNGSRAQYFFQIKRDQKKYEWCQINDITLVEIYKEDLPLTEAFFKKLGVAL